MSAVGYETKPVVPFPTAGTYSLRQGKRVHRSPWIVSVAFVRKGRRTASTPLTTQTDSSLPMLGLAALADDGEAAPVVGVARSWLASRGTTPRNARWSGPSPVPRRR